MIKKENNKKTLSWIYKRTKHYIPGIFIISLLSGIVAISFVLLALVSRNVIDIATGSRNGSFVISGIQLFAIVILQVVLSGINSILKARISGKLTISLRDYMFSSLVKKKYPLISVHHSGDLLNRFTSDIDVIVTSVTSIIPNIVSMAAKIIAGVGTLLFLNSTFAVIVLAVGITVPAIGKAINKKYKYLHKECQRTEGEARSFLQECFLNIVVIKSFISEVPFVKKLGEYMYNNYHLKMKRNNISVIANLSLYSFFTVGYYVVLIWGANSIAAGAITYGTLMAFLQLVSQLRAPLQNVSGIVPQYYSAIASAERLIELEDIENEAEPSDEQELAEIKSAFNIISVNHLNFAYDNEEILKDCTFDIERGHITAITGESGSGKSTLFKILLGLYEPNSGDVTINGKYPVNSSTRGLFAYVPQGNLILSGSIRENITLCDSSISDNAIINAAKTAVIYDFIETLPDGLDTVVSERGSGLSEGQIQRIAIARALLYDAPILLFDESTSALDEATETQLLSNIKNMREKTVIFITHRNTSISVCDKIVHVEAKKFVTIK